MVSTTSQLRLRRASTIHELRPMAMTSRVTSRVSNQKDLGWGRWTGGKLAIVSNEECISCGECTRYCQMGIDVRAFAQREEPLSNATTTCIFCGICVTVCPVDVLSVQRTDRTERDSS